MGWLGIRWVGGRLVREMRGEINDLSVVFFLFGEIFSTKHINWKELQYTKERLPYLGSLIFETQLTFFFVESP